MIPISVIHMFCLCFAAGFGVTLGVGLAYATVLILASLAGIDE